jgi:hypothetical protein
VQRLSAARRPEAGAVDRQVAVGGLLLSAIALLCAVGFTNAPLPEVLVRDPAAARDLVSLMRSGERGRWIVQYDFTRTLADGRVLRQTGNEGRSASWHVVRQGAAMTIERGNLTYTCALVGDRSGCTKTADHAALPESEVVRVAVAAGAYDVVRMQDATIAGIGARCFRMRATGQGSLPEFGVETDRCLSAEGVPLRLFVARPPGYVNEQVATTVRRRATTAHVRALAAAFAAEGAAGQR